MVYQKICYAMNCKEIFFNEPSEKMQGICLLRKLFLKKMVKMNRVSGVGGVLSCILIIEGLIQRSR